MSTARTGGPPADGPGFGPGRRTGPRWLAHADRWTLRRRVSVLLAAVAVVLVASVATITLSALQAYDAVLRQVDELTPAQSAVQQTVAAYLNQDNGVRGYALTRDVEFLSPYQQGRNSLEEALPRLEEVAGTNTAIDSDIRALIAAGEAWHRDFAEPTLAKVDQGEEITAQDYRLGRERFNDLRSAANIAERHIDTELRDAREGQATATQQLVALLSLVGLVVFVLCAFLWVMLRHWVLRPLDELGRHLQQVSDGYYAHRIVLHGPPEIQRVGRDVDAMRERIVHDLHEVATARRTLQEQSELLERQTEELRRSNLELEQFAYVASHDLQEPLRKVASFCQLLQRRYHGRLDERADSYIDFAVEGAKRMQTLINDLLAFSRVGRTRDFGPVDLNVALDDALRSLDAALEEAEAVVTGDELPAVSGDRTLLTQVFFNLVGNAVKFRGERPARVHVSVRRERDEWVFCCADNGIGIEPQYAERIFVIFQRLHTRDKYSGTGIGLAMCKKIVEFHGGRIWLDAESEEPGTRICWSLPARPGTVRAAEEPAAGGGESGGSDREGSDGGAAAPAPEGAGDEPAGSG
ncbi:sensor histidine kinase [Marinitenerispora sediminis]|uniref:histidine kinase n=1 Tax=Marinitenerispora sediminis TaxID=1931232 RepID=A0A368T784_9ACTN|nr:histidine kinase [Marinitenerispora sediminis]RCV58842.1 histidine kinase [Marinitenerispora sediminis]RCV59360.1 histidine kinase [Marinitenerispora sediminis]